ncbi:MAG: heparin lyase I family protein [Verrucomicrobiia bacterium]|jgi:hypothetical protein
METPDSQESPKPKPRRRSRAWKISGGLVGLYALLLVAGEFRIKKGNIYRVDALLGTHVFIKHHFDTEFYAKNYELIDGIPHVIDHESGKRYPTRRNFEDGFENADSIHDLIGLERWMQFTVQSPSAPTVPDYNALRKRILNDGADFIDNLLTPHGEQVHSGTRALKAYSVLPTSGMSTCKAALHRSLFHFVKGDDVWFSGWFYFEQVGEYNTLMDLESTWVPGHPGMRIVLQKGLLSFQLAKWEPKRSYRQSNDTRTKMPTQQWVQITSRLHLREDDTGIVQLWQDGKLLIDERGQTLPFAGAVYDDFEIGLSAHSKGKGPALLYVDDVSIGDQPIAIK